MKQRKQIIFSIVLMVFVLSVLPFMNASAASKPTCKSSYTIWWFSSKQGFSSDFIRFKSGDIVKSVKSNNKNIVRAIKCDNHVALFRSKKPGTAKVTIKVKRGKKTYTLKTKVTTVKFNPFKSVKIGKTDITGAMNSYLFKAVKQSVSGKLDYKLNSGWELISLKITDLDGKYVKASTPIDDCMRIAMTVKHKKTGKQQTVYFDDEGASWYDEW